MAGTTWTGTLYYGCISLILTATVAIVPIVISAIASWFGSEGDKSLGISWIYLAIVFVTCMFIPAIQHLPRGRLDPRGKAVLITGCDSGFGFLLAKQLDALGMHVFAGCYLKDKGGDGARKLEETGSDRLKTVQLDVTDEKSVKDTAEFIKRNLPPGAKGLWGLVNNAGTSAFGDIECSSISLYKRVAEVNLWGVIRMTQACLPMIRRSQGRVVTVSSGLSRMTAPSRSVYCVSKYGVDCFMTCLQYEMKRWGVKASIISPGNYIAGTSIMTKDNISALSERMWNEMEDHIKADYGRKYFDKKVLEMFGYCNSGVRDLTPVTDAYEDALLSKRPLLHYYPMTPYWKIRLFIMTHLPEAVGDYLYIYRYADNEPPNKLD